MVSHVFRTWLSALEERYLADLTFAEVRRALQALSSLYVERRGSLSSGAALNGAGKRAAFAMFYGPLHFLLVQEIVRALEVSGPPPVEVLDLGCGTGASGAAWAMESGGRTRLTGVDRATWAIHETRWTWRSLGLSGTARRQELNRVRLPGHGGGVLASFTVNELELAEREILLPRLLEAAGHGATILIVEPIGRRPIRWWEAWSTAFAAVGGRENTWRFPVQLPELLRSLDRAAGLDHRELTARSLWLGAGRR